MRTSIRDIVRRERWADNITQLRDAIASYEATLVPEPKGGWQVLVEDAWRRYAEQYYAEWRRHA
jgi:hypothetical protein